LRGEVVTVVDLKAVLGLGRSAATRESRNLIVSHNDELVGFWVDRIADILTVTSEAIDPTPPNVDTADTRHFQGVYALEEDIVIVLNVDTVLEMA
ncbi:MAG: chemotaxis protein CheW, partial [Planctomycetales bacterium]|nr:chemotaxis protein CheW [Planctomycetales bacterium]